MRQRQTSRDRSTARPFLFIGNHPALDFINTEMIENGRRVDLLPDVAQLVAWLAQAKLLTTAEARTAHRRWIGRPQGDRLLQAVRAYRAEVRHLVDRIHARRPVPQSALTATNAWLRHDLGYPQLFRTDKGFVTCYRRRHDRFEELLAVLAETVADMLARRELHRIKQCRNKQCILYFYDATKNQGRRWCCMSLCGNRIKVAAHYRRQRGKD